MTDKEIMQALNCCTSKSISCQKCPLLRKSKCERELIQYSFDLINRHQAEIDELRKRIVFWRQVLNYNPKAERAEAIREFADMFDDELAKLRDTYFERDLKDYSLVCEVIHDYLYRTLREMEGAESDSYRNN